MSSRFKILQREVAKRTKDRSLYFSDEETCLFKIQEQMNDFLKEFQSLRYNEKLDKLILMKQTLIKAQEIVMEKKNSALNLKNLKVVQNAIDNIEHAVKKAEIERNKKKLADKVKVSLKDKLELFARK